MNKKRREFNNSKNPKRKPTHEFEIDWKKTRGKKNKRTGEMEQTPIKYLVRSFDTKTRKTITVEKRRKGGTSELVQVKVKEMTKFGKIYYKRKAINQ